MAHKSQIHIWDKTRNAVRSSSPGVGVAQSLRRVFLNEIVYGYIEGIVVRDVYVVWSNRGGCVYASRQSNCGGHKTQYNLATRQWAR